MLYAVEGSDFRRYGCVGAIVPALLIESLQLSLSGIAPCIYPLVSLRPPLLMPVALNLLNEEDSVSVRIQAFIEANMSEDVGFVVVAACKCVGSVADFQRGVSVERRVNCRLKTTGLHLFLRQYPPSLFWQF